MCSIRLLCCDFPPGSQSGGAPSRVPGGRNSQSSYNLRWGSFICGPGKRKYCTMWLLGEVAPAPRVRFTLHCPFTLPQMMSLVTSYTKPTQNPHMGTLPAALLKLSRTIWNQFVDEIRIVWNDQLNTVDLCRGQYFSVSRNDWQDTYVHSNKHNPIILAWKHELKQNLSRHLRISERPTPDARLWRGPVCRRFADSHPAAQGVPAKRLRSGLLPDHGYIISAGTVQRWVGTSYSKVFLSPTVINKIQKDRLFFSLTFTKYGAIWCNLNPIKLFFWPCSEGRRALHLKTEKMKRQMFSYLSAGK